MDTQPEKEHFLQSKLFRGIIYGLAIATVASLIFNAGAAVGSRRAFFTCKWGENYGQNFGSHAVAEPKLLIRRDAPAPIMGRAIGFHGVLGKVVTVTDDGIVVMGNDDIERSVVIDDDTEIRNGRDETDRSGLANGLSVMVFGEPNDQGRILAKLIRILTESLQP